MIEQRQPETTIVADTQSNVRGLDMGTSRIVMATSRDNRFQFESQLNAFVSLPYSKVTEQMLNREQIMHKVDSNAILAYGNRVEQFANMLSGDTRRPMQTGLLNPNEPKSLEMIEVALRKMCGTAKPGEKICFSVPSASESNESNLIYHERTITQILEKLGYAVTSLNEGLAVVYAELEDANFTGIGVSFGGGMCNMCFAYLGMSVLSFATDRAGDYIDHSAASVNSETPMTVRVRKEHGFALNGLSTNTIDQALSVYYKDVIQAAVNKLERALRESKKLPTMDRAMPLVIAGGTSQAGSFDAEFRKALAAKDLPIEISEVRVASDPLHTTAKGTLMAAMLDA